ncbi:MAG: hypothetical protein GY841_21280 [FCB group bacterium]|nr:hypothetical protein [FCB group bacterium]
MSNPKSISRRFLRVLLWLVAIILILFALQVTVLAFPQIVLSQCEQVGTVAIYHDDASGTDISALATEVDLRLQANRFYESSRRDRVFLFHSQKLFEFYARLALVSPKVQGFNLSVFGNSYLNAARIVELSSNRSNTPKYSIWEGSLAHTIAHEVGHQYLIDQIGRSTWMRLPHWKQEGLPEYIASISLIRSDSLLSLYDRFGILNSDQAWDDTYEWDRIHYKAELMVEYLLEVKRYSIEDIIADTVLAEDVYSEMLDWYNTARPQI